MNYFDKEVSFEELKGQVITKIDDDGDFISFYVADGSIYKMGHYQDCCEHVYVEDIIGGELEDLVGEEILLAEKVSSGEDPDNAPKDIIEDEYRDSYTWTFYKLSTMKNSITIRWYGTSNGYYSESVDFYKVDGKLNKNQ